MNEKRKIFINDEELIVLNEIESRKTQGGSVVAKLLYVFGRAVHALGDVTVSNDVQYGHVGRGM